MSTAHLILADAALALGRLCGIPVTDAEQTGLVTADAPPSPGIPPDGHAALELAHAQNPFLRASRVQTQASTIEVDVTENGVSPQLDVALRGV